jgi:hypothetical protein
MQRWRGCLPIIGYFAELQERHAMTQPDTFRMRVVLGNRVFDYAAGQ